MWLTLYENDTRNVVVAGCDDMLVRVGIRLAQNKKATAALTVMEAEELIAGLTQAVAAVRRKATEILANESCGNTFQHRYSQPAGGVKEDETNG